MAYVSYVGLTNSNEVLDIMENGEGIILFGYAFNNATRSVINTIIDAAIETNISKIYYLEIYTIKDIYESNNTLDPKLVRAGSDAYHKMVIKLKNYLNEYYVYSNNIGFDTGVHEITPPTLLAIKNGEVIDINVGELGRYRAYKEEKLNELKTKYIDLMNKYNDASNKCNINGAC